MSKNDRMEVWSIRDNFGIYSKDLFQNEEDAVIYRSRAIFSSEMNYEHHKESSDIEQVENASRELEAIKSYEVVKGVVTFEGEEPIKEKEVVKPEAPEKPIKPKKVATPKATKKASVSKTDKK